MRLAVISLILACFKSEFESPVCMAEPEFRWDLCPQGLPLHEKLRHVLPHLNFVSLEDLDPVVPEDGAHACAKRRKLTVSLWFRCALDVYYAR